MNRSAQKAIAALLSLTLMLLLFSCGSKTGSSQEGEGPLSLSEISEYEALYGQQKDKALNALGLSQEDIETQDQFAARIKKQRVILEKESVTELLFDVVPQEGSFSGILFAFQEEDEDKAKELIEPLYQLSKELYGEPSTYVGSNNSISNWLSGDRKQLLANYLETWSIEKTEYSLRIDKADTGIVFTLHYRFGG